MNDFKQFGGFIITDLGKYCREYVRNNPTVRIYVGCDSKQFRKATVYAIVICFYHQGHGGHVIFKREYIKPKICSMFERLWQEVEYSRIAGEYLEKELSGVYRRINANEKLVDIDLDFNPSAKFKSNAVHDSGVGMLRGLGYRVRTKPGAWASSCAADLLCK